VIGFDDLAIAGMAHPSLSTLRQEKAQLGELAAEALLRQMDANGDGDGDDLAANQLLPVTLVVRESTCGDRTELVT
jgi:DNA-binding LacI/PurR family transcriptional regulator